MSERPTNNTATMFAPDQSMPEPSSTGAPPAQPSFPVARRGYDTSSVDRKFALLAKEKSASPPPLAETRQRNAELEEQLQRAGGAQPPTYAELGGRASELLRLAEEQADEVIAAARVRADEIVRTASAEAQTLRMQAARDAEDMRMVQLKELDEARTSAMGEVERLRALAQSESEDLLASAERESSQRRLAAEQESNALRTSARREAEQLLAATNREVQEMHRALAVEKERLPREAAEHHSNAVAETAALLQESEERADIAEQRAREAINLSTSHRQQAAEEAERELSRARREA